MMKQDTCMMLAACMVLSAMFAAAGCSVLKPIEGTGPDQRKLPSQRGSSPVYHAFDDILIPGDLKVNRRNSSLFQAEAVSMGVLSFNGKMETGVLLNFFKDNMAKDNWQPVGGFQAPRSLLLFEKGNRWCVIALTDERYGFATRVDIWVAPKNN